MNPNKKFVSYKVLEIIKIYNFCFGHVVMHPTYFEQFKI
jgi:hypothetical protein